jgi:molybdopterin-guanine dinucleotide biosynthesis protein A
MNLPACYILCGGQSRRFGADKARVPIADQPQLVHLATALQAAGHRVEYVADRADRYADLGITCLIDPQADSGPLAGLASALAHLASQADSGAGEGWLMLVSCDQARWNEQWFAELDAARRAAIAARAAAYFDIAWQPLPALYHIDLLNDIEQRLRDRRLSLQALLSDLAADQCCARVAVREAPSAWSFNTPDELAGLQQR